MGRPSADQGQTGRNMSRVFGAAAALGCPTQFTILAPATAAADAVLTATVVTVGTPVRLTLADADIHDLAEGRGISCGITAKDAGCTGVKFELSGWTPDLTPGLTDRIVIASVTDTELTYGFGKINVVNITPLGAAGATATVRIGTTKKLGIPVYIGSADDIRWLKVDGTVTDPTSVSPEAGLIDTGSDPNTTKDYQFTIRSTKDLA